MKNALIYTAVAVAAAVAGFVIYRAVVAPQGSSPPAAAPIEKTGQAPEVLPDFTLADLAGEPLSIRSWPGRSLIVNFWATWCAPCRREIPLLKQIQQEHGPEGFQVVGVAVDFREDVIAYADEIGIDYPLMIGEEDGLEAVNAFGISAVGFPFTVFTDQQGRIVMMHLGELVEPQADVILEAVRQVNRGDLSIPQARTRVANALAELEAEAG